MFQYRDKAIVEALVKAWKQIEQDRIYWDAEEKENRGKPEKPIERTEPKRRGSLGIANLNNTQNCLLTSDRSTEKLHHFTAQTSKRNLHHNKHMFAKNVHTEWDDTGKFSKQTRPETTQHCKLYPENMTMNEKDVTARLYNSSYLA